MSHPHNPLHNKAKHINTQYLSAERAAEIITKKGIAECLSGLAEYILQDFLRWQDFDKSARVANHSRDGVIEL
ncbi:MAG: hypothetical protein P1U57_10780, partial [Oleibacter sp.]|nr:hypothetical protein [Thalassolituus sp.]